MEQPQDTNDAAGATVPEYDVIISDGGRSIEFKRSNAEVSRDD